MIKKFCLLRLLLFPEDNVGTDVWQIRNLSIMLTYFENKIMTILDKDIIY